MFESGLSAEHIVAGAHSLWMQRIGPTTMAQVGKEV
jgi:hypothetical protein